MTDRTANIEYTFRKVWTAELGEWPDVPLRSGAIIVPHLVRLTVVRETARIKDTKFGNGSLTTNSYFLMNPVVNVGVSGMIRASDGTIGTRATRIEWDRGPATGDNLDEAPEWVRNLVYRDLLVYCDAVLEMPRHMQDVMHQVGR